GGGGGGGGAGIFSCVSAAFIDGWLLFFSGCIIYRSNKELIQTKIYVHTPVLINEDMHAVHRKIDNNKLPSEEETVVVRENSSSSRPGLGKKTHRNMFLLLFPGSLESWNIIIPISTRAYLIDTSSLHMVTFY
ncbi:hypothetical protein ACJX0J_018538, partial [Zea mays]